MGCNCGQSKKKNVVYDYTLRGVTKTYQTEIEARAAQIRNSGGTIKPRTVT